MEFNDLKNMKPGDVFTSQSGRRYLVLENNYMSIKNNICLMDYDNRIDGCDFDEDNGDWMGSSIRAYLNMELLERYQEDFNNKIIQHDIDCSALDGTDAYTVKDYVSLLTHQQFKKYRKLFEKYQENYFPEYKSWWLLTRLTSHPDCNTNVFYVSEEAIIFYDYCWSEKDIYGYFEVTFNEV